MRTTQTILETVLERQADGKGLQRGLVLAVNPGGFVTVVMDQKEITCDVLQAAAQPLTPARGDSVLVWLPVGDDLRPAAETDKAASTRPHRSLPTRA